MERTDTGVLRRLFRVALAGVGRTLKDGAKGFEVVEDAALRRVRTTSCASVLRCASIRRAGRRRTSGRVRASPARQRWLLPEGDQGRFAESSGSRRSRSTATTTPATGVHNPAMRRSAASRQRRVGDDHVQRRVAPQPRASVPEKDGANDQSHQQQTDPGPAAGERGIEASQHVPRHDYSSWRRELRPPTGSVGVTL